MKIQLVVAGKLKEPIASLAREYEKRINRFANFEVLELKDNGKYEDALIARVKDAMLILFDEKGDGLSSMEFADFINKNWGNNLIFAIGPGSGFSEEIKSKTEYLISLSHFTLQHDIAALIGSEAIYRAFTIINNHPYHRE